MFGNLFSPLSLGRLKLENRIVFLAHRTNYAQNGLLSDRHIAYYKRRAQGGCGLIILGDIAIHPNDRPWECVIEAYNPSVLKQFKKLTDAVHQHGTPIIANLNHHGFQSSGAITHSAIWGPSPVSDIVFGETAKAMECEDMKELVSAFADAALLAKQGGFDGIEIDMGPESLLRQFLSTLSNHRTDDYGGSLENRMRLPLEVFEGIVNAVGEDFPVGIHLCADEKFWGAITIEESRQIAQKFDSTGHVDFFNISVGSYYNLYLIMATMYTPPGLTVEPSANIKEVVHVPVISGYQINSPQMADDIIANHRADAIGFVRPLICDPDFPKKSGEGRPETIRYCVQDNEGCLGRVNQSKMLSCTQNSHVGCESLNGQNEFIPTLMKKMIVVVGAGPAGLEAARVASLRGHEVMVYEKEKYVGGQILRMLVHPSRSNMKQIIQNLNMTLDMLQVPIITGFELTAEAVLEMNPDAVVIATGSKPVEKPYPGKYKPGTVLNVFDVLEGRYPLGRKILLIDEHGGHYAASTAEMLADQNREVHMVTSDLFIGIELANIGDLYFSRQRLLQKGVIFKTDIVIDSIDGDTVKGRNMYTNNPVLFQGYETIVLAMGNKADDTLYRQLKGRVKELYRAGDCVAPRNIAMAILEGRKVGEQI